MQETQPPREITLADLHDALGSLLVRTADLTKATSALAAKVDAQGTKIDGLVSAYGTLASHTADLHESVRRARIRPMPLMPHLRAMAADDGE